MPAAPSAAVGPIPSARSRSVVGQMQQRDRHAASISMSRSLTCVACTAVNRGLSAPTSSSTWTGVRPVRGEALGVLLRLLRHVGMDDGIALAGEARPRRPSHSGRTARTEWIAAPMRQVAVAVSDELDDALGPCFGGPVAEARLHRVELGVDAAGQVAGVEQRQADAGAGRQRR